MLIEKGGRFSYSDRFNPGKTMVLNNLLASSVRLSLLSIKARLDQSLRFGLRIFKADMQTSPILMIESLQDRVLLSSVPAVFYVHTFGEHPTVIAAHFLTDGQGNYIQDPNSLPLNDKGQPIKLYLTNDPNSNDTFKRPDNAMIFPLTYTIDGAIANAQSYHMDLGSLTAFGNTVTIGINNVASLGLDFLPGGSQDLQTQNGAFYPAFQSAASFNLGLQTGFDGIPALLPWGAAIADDLHDKNNTSANLYNLFPDASAVQTGYQYGQTSPGAVYGNTTQNGSVTLEDGSPDGFNSDTFTLQSNGNIQDDEELNSGSSEDVLFEPQSDITEETQTYSGPDLSGTLEDQTIDYVSGASVSTSSDPTDGSQDVLSNVTPGEDINVQVDYSTTDENENGEGESLTISTSGGDSVSDASYNATSVYNFVATAAGESVLATPVGWDGDESATVTVTVSSLSGTSITPVQEGAFSVGSSDLDTSAAGLGTVGASFAGGVSTYSQGAVDAADAASALDATLAANFSDLSIDPIDTNYTTVVRPAKTTTAILPTAKDFKGIKNAGPLAASIRALDLNEEKSINLAVAADATANKLEGALAVGNAKWTKEQKAVLKSYKKQLSALVKAQVVLSNNEAKQLNKSPLASETVSSTDVNNFEETVNDDGLPSQLLTDLNDLGLSTAAQTAIQQAIFAQDIDTASGTYASMLTNPTLEADLAKLSLLLKAG